MASVHARPLQAPGGLDPEGDEEKTDREQSGPFREVRDTGTLRLEGANPQCTPFPTPGLLHALTLTGPCLSPQAPESTGSDYLVPLSVPSANVPANGLSLSLSWVVGNNMISRKGILETSCPAGKRSQNGEKTSTGWLEGTWLFRKAGCWQPGGHWWHLSAQPSSWWHSDPERSRHRPVRAGRTIRPAVPLENQGRRVPGWE